MIVYQGCQRDAFAEAYKLAKAYPKLNIKLFKTDRVWYVTKFY